MSRIVKTMLMTAVLVCSLFTMAAAESVTFAVGEWAPFISETLPGNGSDGEVVRAAMKAVGMDVNYEYNKWNRNNVLVQKGERAGSFPWSIKEDRKAFAIFSDPISKSREVFLYRKDKMGADFDFASLADLKQYKVAGIRGYSHVKILTDAGIEPDMSNDLETALKKLEAGRVDLVPDNELVIWGKAKEMFGDGVSDFAMTKNALSEADMYVMFSKKYPGIEALVAKFNEGLAKIKASGEYDKIQSKYK